MIKQLQKGVEKLKGLRRKNYTGRKRKRKRNKKSNQQNKLLLAIAIVNLITAIIGLIKIIFF